MKPVSFLVFVTAAFLLVGSSTPGEAAKPKTAPKTKLSFTFEAHNENIEGNIYGAENLVSVTIDEGGIRYQAKGVNSPQIITWEQVLGWQGNNFTSHKPTAAAEGDFGIGIYKYPFYVSFRIRSGRDYLAAIKAMRTYASAKEHPGE